MKKILFATLLAFGMSLFGANATPTAVSSMTVAGNVGTVNSTAHGLAVNQGFCITNSSQTADNVCGVVATVPTANQFTFDLSGLVACASACGTAQPALQAIVLSESAPDQGHTGVRYLLWLTTTQPCPGPAASQWVAANGSGGASQAENNAIASGMWVEKVKSQVFPSNSSAVALESFLQNDWAMEQQALANNIQPCQWYGQAFDGFGWAKN